LIAGLETQVSFTLSAKTEVQEPLKEKVWAAEGRHYTLSQDFVLFVHLSEKLFRLVN
jgi:hypothetical protein